MACKSRYLVPTPNTSLLYILFCTVCYVTFCAFASCRIDYCSLYLLFTHVLLFGCVWQPTINGYIYIYQPLAGVVVGRLQPKQSCLHSPDAADPVQLAGAVERQPQDTVDQTAANEDMSYHNYQRGISEGTSKLSHYSRILIGLMFIMFS